MRGDPVRMVGDDLSRVLPLFVRHVPPAEASLRNDRD
jgi:hypothetical protein